MHKESQLERDLASMIKLFKLPEPQREYRFDAKRRWRFDFAWPAHMVGVECEGGIWIKGAHTRGKHYESDCRKYNSAAMQGWCVLRFTSSMIRSWEAARTIHERLGGHGQSLVFLASNPSARTPKPKWPKGTKITRTIEANGHETIDFSVPIKKEEK